MQAAPQISAELQEKYNTVARKAMEHYKANCTEEQKQLMVAHGERFKNDPEYTQQKLATMTEQWTSSDADSDGRLNRAEFLAFRQKQYTAAASEGFYVEQREGGDDELYDCHNGLNPDAEGISHEEYKQGIAIFMQGWEQFKQEMGA